MSEKTKTEKRTRSTTAFPKISLMEALQIANAIKEHNAGNPYDRLDLAKAVNRSPGASQFRMLITASGQFGLTEGSYNSKSISLTPLGRSIVFPESPQKRIESIRKAFFSVPLFKRFFEDFDKNKLPSIEYLEGTLNRTYGIPVQDCKNCYKMIVKNATELGILDEISGAHWINLSKLSPPSLETETVTAKIGEGYQTRPPATIPTPAINIPTVGKEGVVVKVSINFELPITKDAEVYDKIFQSLKKNILTPDSKKD
jgi:hypothetical protein